jgi:hypothetical protein
MKCHDAVPFLSGQNVFHFDVSSSLQACLYKLNAVHLFILHMLHDI